MKFIPIDSARKLKIDEPVYTLDENGEYGYGRLIEERKTSNGVTRTFEMASFAGTGSAPGYYKTNITHIAIPK